MLSSIRSRLTLWYVGVLALLIIAFALVTYLLVSRNLDETLNRNLQEVGRSIETDLKKEEADIAAERLMPFKPVDEEGEDEDEKKPEIEPDEVPLTIEAAIAEEINDLRSRDYGFLVLAQNGQLIASSVDDAALRNRLTNLPPGPLFVDLPGGNEGIRVYRKPLGLDGKKFQLLITHSLREQTDFLASLRNIFFIALPVALVLAGLGGYFLARRSLAPVVAMSGQAASISSANLTERLPVKNERDELGSLAKVFNDLLSRLENSFQQQKQFMADASHELRTPLAIVRGESEVAISLETRSAEEYLESLGVVHDESLRLTKIVDDLFTLARADSGQLKPQFAELYVDEILADCIRHMRTLAEKKKVSLNLISNGELPFRGDENLLHRLFLNLLDNAIKYNRPGGSVTVECEDYRITVSDTGNGIPLEVQARIFERFFRVDSARSRSEISETAGAGLGLSIAQWVAEVHHGSLILRRSDLKGSVFQLDLLRQGRCQTRDFL